MEKKYVIVLWQGNNVRYLHNSTTGDQSKAFGDWSPYEAYKFKNKTSAELHLNKYKSLWGGVFEIRPVYINR